VNEDSPREACGLFGVWAPGEDVARLAYFGLYALQHRGQESAGIAVSDGHNILVYRELGLVSQVFDERTLSTLQGDLAIGHNRYSTTGSTTWENAQPSFKTDGSRGLALGHNGNLVNTEELAGRVGRRGPATTDSDLVASLLAAEGDDLEAAALRVLSTLQGAFSFVLMDERTVFGARDPHGLRPLAIGRLDRGWVLASETAALDIVGAEYVREVEPGELVMLDDRGLRSARYAESPRAALCLFEFVYLARADSRLYGRTVHEARQGMGRRLAREAPGAAGGGVRGGGAGWMRASTEAAPVNDWAPNCLIRPPTCNAITAPKGMATRAVGMIVTEATNHACCRNSRSWKGRRNSPRPTSRAKAKSLPAVPIGASAREEVREAMRVRTQGPDRRWPTRRNREEA
jgi:hypothetical protein